MKIVLTNDDGIEAPGLAALARACQGLGELFVVAPAEEQSSCGHRVSYGTLGLHRTDRGHVALEGTPADCTRVALRHLVPDADWLISGINRGGNLGADTYVSGTVAAAREAALLGRRALALSQYVCRGRDLDWDLVTRRARRAIRRILERDDHDGGFWNVNLPHPEHTREELELVRCPLDPHPLDVRFEENGRGLVFTGDYRARRRRPGSDVDVCFNGHIALSRIPIELPH